MLQQQYLSQDNTVLNSQSPQTYYELGGNNGKEVVFTRRSKFAETAEKNLMKYPDINNNNRGISHGQLPDLTSMSGKSNRQFDDTYGNTEKLLQGSKNLLMVNSSMNAGGGKRGKSSRPMMQVKNGKLLLVKAV